MSHMGACLLPFIGFVPGCYLIKVGRMAVDDDVTDGIKADGGERDPLPSIGVVPALFCLLLIVRYGRRKLTTRFYGKTGLLIRSIVMRGCSCDAGRIRQQRGLILLHYGTLLFDGVAPVRRGFCYIRVSAPVLVSSLPQAAVPIVREWYRPGR